MVAIQDNYYYYGSVRSEILPLLPERAARVLDVDAEQGIRCSGSGNCGSQRGSEVSSSILRQQLKKAVRSRFYLNHLVTGKWR